MPMGMPAFCRKSCPPAAVMALVASRSTMARYCSSVKQRVRGVGLVMRCISALHGMLLECLKTTLKPQGLPLSSRERDEQTLEPRLRRAACRLSDRALSMGIHSKHLETSAVKSEVICCGRLRRQAV